MNRSRILIAFAVVFTTACFAYYVTAASQQRGGQAQNAFAIEAGFTTENALSVPVSGGGDKRTFAIIPIPADQRAQRTGDTVSGVKLVTRAEGKSVRVDISTLYGSIDKVTPCNLAEVRQQFVASYRLALGDEISVSELQSHGVGPLGIKLVRAEAGAARAPEGPSCCKCIESGIACCPNVGECLTCGSCGYCCGIGKP